jgi:hypothetical protein
MKLHPSRPLAAMRAYFRLKIWRRLQNLGAVALRLPANEQTQEDFDWLLKDMVEGDAEAMICEARLIDGLSEQGRAQEIVAIGLNGANGRETVDGLLTMLDASLQEDHAMARSQNERRSFEIEALEARVRVTRKGVHVDRIASPWLIRRFTDIEIPTGARWRRARIASGRNVSATVHVQHNGRCSLGSPTRAHLRNYCYAARISRVRCVAAVRRLQAVRLGSRDGCGSLAQLHRSKGHHRGVVIPLDFVVRRVARSRHDRLR